MGSLNRREFLGSIACAMAVAALPCSIPAQAFESEPPKQIATYTQTEVVGVVHMADMHSTWDMAMRVNYYRPKDSAVFYLGDVVTIDSNGWLIRCLADMPILGVVVIPLTEILV